MKEPTIADLRMFKNFLYLFLLLTTQVYSCKSVVPSNLQDSNSIEMELILNENYSGFEQENYILIKNQKDLNAFYGKINRTRKPGLTPPKVDFDSEMILVWCGDYSASEYAQLVVREKDTLLEIQNKRSKVAKEENSLIVSPFSVYKLPLSSKSIKIKQ
ncbi:hypothetical protein [Maribacter litoralis]|uniref:hypothetical protein n=1 Tax=Maribacter litoralis TaxID=2059726 RepID=UPI000E31DE3E|nr:hypothetical protein [Maribacter litoralis]